MAFHIYLGISHIYLTISTLLVATSLSMGFVAPIPKSHDARFWAASRGFVSSNQHFRRPLRPDTSREAILGPDGKEMDVRRHREAYSYPEYWEKFYAGGEAGDLEAGESYDWFFGYSRLAVYLNLHVGGARNGRVLVLGCGNSEVSPKMWENGWKNILSIDFCKPVIESMELAHGDKPGLEWKVMDARNMADLETESFDAVIDKGLTDSIMYNDQFSIMMAKVSYEVARVLKPGGVYLMTDYREPDRVQELFKRDEWEGGSLTQEGKITPTVYLFKGKRSNTAPRPPSREGKARVAGSVYFGDSEEFEGEEAPGWLADGIESGELREPEDGPDLDLPPEDVGQKKPFKF